MASDTVRDLMTPDPERIEPDASALAALELMIDRGIRHLPVVDRGGRIRARGARPARLVREMLARDPDRPTARLARRDLVCALRRGRHIVKGKQPKKERAAKSGGRPQATRLEQQGDVYRRKRKHVEVKAPEDIVCPECHAIRRAGRWCWATVPDPAGRARELCPACQRIRDGYPAGEVRISGAFARAHRAEILARVRHVEEREQAEHPLNRLIGIRDEADAIVVTTADVHLAHAIGAALHDAFKGELQSPWVEEGVLLRVTWKR